MSETCARDFRAEIAQLQSQIDELTELAGAAPRRHRSRRPFAIVAAAILAVGTLAGVAGAAGSTTNVSFVFLSPAKTVLSNVSIATHKSNSPVVIGGTTTVPSNATTVDVRILAKGTAAGTLNFYPAGNPAGASGQSLAYPSGSSFLETTIQENVGQSGELTIYNAGGGTATVTATIIGYSTQVTAGDINGADGSSGQVLTNDGNGGASWQSLPASSGGGAASGSLAGNVFVAANASTVVDKISLAPGIYHIVSTYNGTASAPAFINCFVESPGLSAGQLSYADINQVYSGDGSYNGAGTAQALVRTSGGYVSLVCDTIQNPAGATVESEYMSATPVASANGVVLH